MDTNETISRAASLMGRKGGSAKSARKAASSRENGKKGGRPINPNSARQRRLKARQA